MFEILTQFNLSTSEVYGISPFSKKLLSLFYILNVFLN